MFLPSSSPAQFPSVFFPSFLLPTYHPSVFINVCYQVFFYSDLLIWLSLCHVLTFFHFSSPNCLRSSGSFHLLVTLPCHFSHLLFFPSICAFLPAHIYFVVNVVHKKCIKCNAIMLPLNSFLWSKGKSGTFDNINCCSDHIISNQEL